MPALDFEDLTPQEPQRKSRGYIATSTFDAELDQILGKGAWRSTGDYRSPQREDQLRAQGAATVAPGQISNHSRGTPDAPGAHDIAVADPQAVLARLRGAPGVRDAFYEGASGSQGGHIHVDATSGPVSFNDLTPGKGPVSFDDLMSKGTPEPLPNLAAKRRVIQQQELGGRPSYQQALQTRQQTARQEMQQGSEEAELSGKTGDVGATFGSLYHGGMGALDFAIAPALAGIIDRGPGYDFARAESGGAHGEARATPQALGDILTQVAAAFGGGEGAGAKALRAGEKLSPEAEAAVGRFEPPALSDKAKRTLEQGKRIPTIRTPKVAPILQSASPAKRSPLQRAQSVFSPETTEHGRPVAEAIRARSGERYQQMAQAEHQLTGRRPVLGGTGMAQAVDRLSHDESLQLIDDIEHRSERASTNPRFQKVVDTVADIYDKAKKRIEYVFGDSAEGGPSFIKDYYKHAWKQTPEQVQRAMQRFYSRQGSGASLRGRIRNADGSIAIPTVADGIRAGLTPVTTNPLEMTSLYVQQMYRYLLTHDVINHMTESGAAKWYHDGDSRIPEGHVPLKGTGVTLRARATGDTTSIGQRRLYAHPDAAGVYNSFADSGFENSAVYRGARALANTGTMVKLGLSAYHAMTTTWEASASAAARTATEASKVPGLLARGEPLGAARAVGRSAKAAAGLAPGAAVTKALVKGRRLEKQVLGLKGGSPLSERVMRAWLDSGGRTRMDPFYRARASGSFYNALKRGTFKSSLMDAAQRIYVGGSFEKVKGTLDLVANVVQSVSAPLFEDIIPNVKRGVFSDSMADFIKSNPNASEEEMNRFAIKLQDSMDNRFGEMVQDYIFWDRKVKQIMQLALLSPSWNIGTVRELAGGLVDLPASFKGIASGEGLTTRTAYVVGLATNLMLSSAVAQYLMTGLGSGKSLTQGTPPQSLLDLAAPRTGGTVQYRGSGRMHVPGGAEPERLAFPGNQKDVFAFVNAVSQGPPGLTAETQGKVNPGVQAAVALGTNKDWRGDPLYHDPPSFVQAVAQQVEPITLEMLSQRKPGTNIAPWATALGARPSPEYLAAPDLYRRQQAARAAYAERLARLHRANAGQ